MSVESSGFNPLSSLLLKVQTSGPKDTDTLRDLAKTAELTNGLFLEVRTFLLVAWIIWPSLSALIWYSFCSYVIHQISVVADNAAQCAKNNSHAQTTTLDLLKGIHLVAFVQWAAKVLGVEVRRVEPQAPEGQSRSSLVVTEEQWEEWNEPGAATPSNRSGGSGGKSREPQAPSGSAQSPFRPVVAAAASPGAPPRS